MQSPTQSAGISEAWRKRPPGVTLERLVVSSFLIESRIDHMECLKMLSAFSAVAYRMGFYRRKMELILEALLSHHFTRRSPEGPTPSARRSPQRERLRAMAYTDNKHKNSSTSNENSLPSLCADHKKATEKKQTKPPAVSAAPEE